MKEIQFQHKNKRKWERFNRMLSQREKVSPDELARLYIEVTDDLAYSRTYYPKSSINQYLNQLAAKAHHKIYQNKRENRGRVREFWKFEFPAVFWHYRRYFFISLFIFLASMSIGIISAANDESFVRLILGDHYVDMTLANIERGEPMAVYKSAQKADMFLGITINNIRVSFMAFTMGIFAGIGTLYVMFSNGVMLGSFEYFFHDHGLLYESVLSIWIHGTLEIFAIIVAGAAGFLIGGSILFPGTYKRMYALKKGARQALKIIIGTVPVFIAAGFLEGFVTRYTQMPAWSRIGIIALSLFFILWYFFFYARNVYNYINSNNYPVNHYYDKRIQL